MNQGLDTKAMLVRLHINQWSNRKKDERATETVEITHQTSKGFGAYSKVLIDPKRLKSLANAISDARSFFRDNTLPWNDDTSRILPAKNFNIFTDGMRLRHQKILAEIDNFIAAYPGYLNAAQVNLGELFKSSEYPDAQTVRSQFGYDLRFDPVPTANDFRVAISKEQVEEMKGNIEKWHQESVANMSKDLWTRLEGVVSHMAEKLSDSKAIFRDSLIGNAEELCCMLSSLNVNDDPELERIRGDLAQKISGIEPARLRKDPTLRQETAEMAKTALEDITKSMSAYFGGKNEAEGNG